ncbi:hypothetical protein TGDOM2_240247 [Toxoplasma gondii GAB2-2007-GAL-DOM2]|uniref:Uncharacterized protein n=5 Tax=Toxoplasma gondii TaxID=5811 RepID=S7URZ2_TOXGG|nr:hypothetical protein TGGT1_240247 [Toxoplasma gondii GT1]KAF4643426.1 hypothetical protein TGRH88_030920 [Toxoplasma gondii]KFG39521.1 hypothetical protein TGDOM2_240247 [Toxoplasma gondii GAB2-2007-GAL-DOM2]KFG48516.1 hypothetical protein TGFOU_240247 [Toxoplasma gondii FOU]RQX70811.1 hypothetical protein TGCAST_240247 [Toxoplasma gondii CAST]
MCSWFTFEATGSLSASARTPVLALKKRLLRCRAFDIFILRWRALDVVAILSEVFPRFAELFSGKLLPRQEPVSICEEISFRGRSFRGLKQCARQDGGKIVQPAHPAGFARVGLRLSSFCGLAVCFFSFPNAYLLDTEVDATQHTPTGATGRTREAR